MQREIAEAAYLYQKEIDTQQRVIVGINDFVTPEPIAIPILEMDPQGYARQVRRLQQVRRERDPRATQQALHRLADAARDPHTNLMEPIIDAVKSYATLGEICDVFRAEFGIYHEPVFF